MRKRADERHECPDCGKRFWYCDQYPNGTEVDEKFVLCKKHSDEARHESENRPESKYE